MNLNCFINPLPSSRLEHQYAAAPPVDRTVINEGFDDRWRSG